MTLLKPGYQSDYHGRPPIFPLGCSGSIVEDERLADGRYNIVLHGRERFRIVEEQGGAPYGSRSSRSCPTLPATTPRLSSSATELRLRARDVWRRVAGRRRARSRLRCSSTSLCQRLDLPVVEKLDLLGLRFRRGARAAARRAARVPQARAQLRPPRQHELDLLPGRRSERPTFRPRGTSQGADAGQTRPRGGQMKRAVARTLAAAGRAGQRAFCSGRRPGRARRTSARRRSRSASSSGTPVAAACWASASADLDGDARGAKVRSVESCEPADKAGIKQGDVIVRFDGEAVRSAGQLARLVEGNAVGKVGAGRGDTRWRDPEAERDGRRGRPADVRRRHAWSG